VTELLLLSAVAGALQGFAGDGSASHPLFWQPSLESPASPRQTEQGSGETQPGGALLLMCQAGGQSTQEASERPSWRPSACRRIPLCESLATSGLREENARLRKLSAVDVEGAAVMAHGGLPPGQDNSPPASLALTASKSPL